MSARKKGAASKAQPPHSPRVQRAIEIVRAQADDDHEVDDTPAVSEGEDGVWVQQWVWVRDAD